MGAFVGPMLSALAYTILIILTGYVMRATRVLNDAEAGGLSRFCSLLALPCALFASVIDLDWSSVDGTLLLGMFLSKAIIFSATSVATLSRSRSPEAVARAGLFSIFTTKSNDIAFALPIVEAIFPDKYANMVYLFVPLQLAIINPIGLMMMEYGSTQSQTGEVGARGAGCARCVSPRRAWTKLLGVVCSTLMSPVMIAVTAGLVVNLALPGRLPLSVRQFVTYCGQAYTSTALITVGSSLSVGSKAAGKGAALDGVSALVGVSLIVVKVVVAALVMYHVCGALTHYDPVTANFAFVYGCMPPAPTVYVWARQYGVASELTGRMLVASLVVATPFIVVTGVIIDLGASRGDLVSTRGLMDTVIDAMDVLGLVSCTWLLVAFAVSPRMRRGLRLEMLPIVVCNAAVSVAALLCVHSPASHAAKLPVDSARQLFQHLALAHATCLSLRLFRSLRTSPERMRAERKWWHLGCLGTSVLLLAAQLLDRSGPRWPPGDVRDDFSCVFGLLNSRAPILRATFLVACTVLTSLPLLLFNVRYLRTELRMNAEATGTGSQVPPAEDVKYSIAIVRTGANGHRRRRRCGRSERGKQQHAAVSGPASAAGASAAEASGVAPDLLNSALGEVVGTSDERAQPSSGGHSVASDGSTSPVPFEAAFGCPAMGGSACNGCRQNGGRLSAPSVGLRGGGGRTGGGDVGLLEAEGSEALSEMFEGGDETSLGNILQAVRDRAAGCRDRQLARFTRDWTFDDGRAGMPCCAVHGQGRGGHKANGAAGGGGGGSAARGGASVEDADDDEGAEDDDEEEEEEEDDEDLMDGGDDDYARCGTDDDGDDESPWIEIRITRRKLRIVEAQPASVNTSSVGQSIAAAAALQARNSTPTDPMSYTGDTDSLRVGLLLRERSRSLPGPGGLLGHGRGVQALRPGRRGSLNYIPMMESLVWTNDCLRTASDRDAHAQVLNQTFNDSLAYLFLLLAAIFSMVLGISLALQDLASVPRLTTLQEEIVLVTKLAFHGQAMVMVAGFGLHPDLFADAKRKMRKLSHWARTRTCVSLLTTCGRWRGGAKEGHLDAPPGATQPPKLSVFRRQYSLAKARFE